MTISPRFLIAQTVYLKVSPENAGMVTGFQIRPGNVLLYLVTFGDEEGERLCYDIELTTEKSFE